MTPRERIDFSILTLFFGALAGAALSAGVMSAEWFVCSILSYIFSDLPNGTHAQQPAGYSAITVGLFGAVATLAGTISAAITAPLFDRVFPHSTLLMLKTMVPILSLGWLSLIWAGKYLQHSDALA